MKKTFQNKNHKTLLLTFAFLLFTLNFFLVSCNTTEPRDGYTLTLTEEDVSCTEAWLKTEAKNFNLPVKVNLYLNDSLKKTITLTTQDTVIYDEGLLPDRTYKYRAEIALSQETVIKSQTIILTTMDTTSHNFTWQTFTFGGANGSSVLYDVAIINENDIWAVGEIHTSWTDQWDSNGVWVQPYNAVHWNGQEWELKRIMFYIDQDQPSAGKTAYPCNSVFLSEDNSLEITSGGQVYILKGDGTNLLLPMGFKWENRFSISSLWGTSSSNFYIVGQNGNIAHYNGTSWEKIESGTTTDINDVWGYYNESNNKTSILAVISNMYNAGDIRLVALSGNQAKDTLNYPYQRRIKGIWFKDNYSPVYVCGEGIMEYERGRWKLTDLTGWIVAAIRGKGLNDIIAVDENGTLLHFNGLRWEIVKNFEDMYFVSIAIKDNTILVVGTKVNNILAGDAVIVVGKQLN